MDADPTVSTHTHAGPPGIDTTPFVSGSTVGRFLIRERLGTGGMGEVYRAEDTHLKRTVAIKRLVHPFPDQGPASRLLKEAQRASALNHPRIAGVYDVFTMGSELLLVMEFVDGVTLRERMKREISVADFCVIGAQCAEALSAAHDKGILHGDVKPANIMLTRDGQVKMCDFGLARRLPASSGAAETTTTTQAGVAGTPAYLAPEAVLERPVDARADIFSLGVVFYQMLALRNPFTDDSLMGTLDRILHASPEPLDRVNPHVPGRLARVVHRMLEKDPGDRPASAAEVGTALTAIGAQHAELQRRRRAARRMQTWAAAAAVGVAAVVAAPRLTNPPGSVSLAPLPSSINLVVLPFAVEGAGDDRASFVDGLTDSLNTQLSRLTTNRAFQVVTEADRRARNVATAPEAREQFSANLALRGSLRYGDEDIEISLALVETRSGRQLRAERVTVDGANPIAVQSRVLDAAIHMLEIDLDSREHLRIAAGTARPGAHDFYLQGRGYLLNYDRIESVDLAIGLFRKALASDQKYALAYAGLGQAYWRKYGLTRSSEWVDFARGACESALGIDAGRAESYVCLAMVQTGTGDYEGAVDGYRRALELEPTNDVAYVGLAGAYEGLKRHADAEQTYLRAIRERPHYWGGYNTLGSYYYRASRFEDALTMYRQVVDLAPDSYRGRNNLGAALFGLDRIADAIEAFTQSMAVRPNFTAASNLGTLYYFEGEFQRAADYFRQALTFDRGRYEVWGNLAHTLEYLGDKAGAEGAFREARTLAIEEVSVNPRNAALHVDLADHHAALGEPDAARRALAQALALAPEDAHTLFRIAVLYETRLHERAQALAWLTRAVNGGQPWREIDRAPDLRQLRTDPGFLSLRKSQSPGSQ